MDLAAFGKTLGGEQHANTATTFIAGDIPSRSQLTRELLC
jgi:hypothetical protein